MSGQRILGNKALTHFDAIVVGSGAGGGPVAHMLCKHGLNVLVLEAGPNHFDFLDDATRQPVPRHSNDELKFSWRGFISPDERLEPRSFRKSSAEGDRSFVGDVNGLPKHVGGGAVHADLKMPRFEPWDFHLASLLGDVPNANFADWPITYDQLEPFYAYVEKEIGIQGLAGANPFEGPRSGPFPMPPGVPMYVAEVASKGLKKLGYTPFPYPTAVNSVPYDGRPACNDCGFCSGFGCAINAKGAPVVSMLRKALLSGHCLMLAETRAVRLLTNSAKSSITGVETVGPDGPATYTADRYVLAASPIEDVRLLQLSGGIGNGSDQVGRNLMFHYQTTAVGIFEERLHGHRGRAVSHGFADFRGKPGDATRPLGGIVEISGSEGPVDEAGYYAQIIQRLSLKWDGKRFKSLMRESPFRDHIIVLVIQAEDAPQATNRVDLDPALVDFLGRPVARITYENHAFETSASQFYAPKLLDILAASGARWAANPPIDDISKSDHIMGTLRFGSDPKTSVCNAVGRFHDVDNLYCTDGAVFPTSSGYNPTHTIITLATRVAADMVNPGSPEKSLV